MKLKSAEEVLVEMPHSPHILSRITETISQSHVDIDAICGYETDGVAHVRLITEDNAAAAEALKKAGFNCSVHTVMIEETSPYAAHPHLEGMYGNIEIDHNYWFASTQNGEHSLLVYSPRDNIRGVRLES